MLYLESLRKETLAHAQERKQEQKGLKTDPVKAKAQIQNLIDALDEVMADIDDFLGKTKKENK